MGGDWSRTTIGAVAEQRTEKALPTRAEAVPYVALENVSSGTGQLQRVAASGIARSHKTRFVAGDTLFGKLRPNLRKVAQVHFDGVCSTDIIAVGARSGADNRYLYHVLSSDRVHRHVMGDITGTKMPRTSWQRLSSYEFRCPTLVEQRAIASVLDSIDEEITWSETLIAATESLRRALMHELLTRGLPGWHTEWKHVPDIGMVPGCWEVSTLGAILCEPIRNGQSMVAPSSETGRWQFTLGAVTFSGLDSTAIKPAPANNRSGAVLELGDLLISRSNTRERVGLAGIYRGEPDACTYPDLLMRVRLDRRVALTDFVEAALLSPRGRDYFERQARGTSGSMVKITGGIAAAFPFARPGLTEQQRIVDIAQGVTRVLGESAQHLAALRALKGAASEALLSGRLRIRDTMLQTIVS